MTTYVRAIDGDGEEYLTTRKELGNEIVAMQDEGFDAEIAIVKEADTIQELCDYFSFDNAFEYANPSLYAFASTARLRAKNHENLIGYIVIEKNGVKALEPVAKTNDEWEFELL